MQFSCRIWIKRTAASAVRLKYVSNEGPVNSEVHSATCRIASYLPNGRPWHRLDHGPTKNKDQTAPSIELGGAWRFATLAPESSAKSAKPRPKPRPKFVLRRPPELRWIWESRLRGKVPRHHWNMSEECHVGPRGKAPAKAGRLC